MIRKLHDCIGAPLRRFDDSPVQRFNGLTTQNLLVFCAVVFPWFARAQTSFPDTSSARSVSGQFIVTGAPSRLAGSRLAAMPGIATNTDFVRLEPALLAVSAERIKESLGRELNPELRRLDFPTPPPGEIFLALHPAQSTNEGVTIVSQRSPDGWDYQVRLPDVLSRTRYLRAMTGVLLLEFANHDARARSAEIPAWLTDGLSQELLATTWQEIILSSPDKVVNGLPVSRTVKTARGLDSLAGARRVLRDHAVLTFEQLSWPTDAQLAGDDDGVYRASAQLFVNELLALKNGPAHLRALLETLPKFYNWQVAFQTAFRENFPRPLDVEKWWAVQVVSFVARDPGPAWTPAVSRDKLDEILSVPVEMRTASNALPAHAEISLQAVLRNFNRSRQFAILQTKLRDLEISQLRMAPPFVVLTDEYRRALADYLEPAKRTPPVLRLGKHPPVISSGPAMTDTLKKLDALDAQRRAIESAIKPGGVSP
ncbi:MAG: hypothetical protein ABSG80_13660 [Verrucomicrobiota bacterium]|jgi:hypothetical protein